MDGEMQSGESSSLPILGLPYADDSSKCPALLEGLHNALFNVGFLYIKDHGVSMERIMNLVSRLPALFDQGSSVKARLSKLNSPHFLGYSGRERKTFASSLILPLSFL